MRDNNTIICLLKTSHHPFAFEDDGIKKPKALADHGNMVSPSPNDLGLFLSAASLAPTDGYNEKHWSPEVRKWTTVEVVNQISYTIVWYRIILSSWCVEHGTFSQNVDVDVEDDGMTL